LAEAYRKLGDSESQKVYERIVRDFADQREAVATARAKLTGDASLAGEFGQKMLWNVGVSPWLGGISADGRYLAHTKDSGGLFVRDIVTGRDRVLATEADLPLKDRSVFSPDGKRLICACWDAATPEIRSYDLSAPGRERRFKFADVTGYVDPHDWSPDGKQIAVEITRGDLGQMQIGLMNPDDGSLRVLESVDWRHSTRLFFSPDSKYLAFDLPAHDGHQRDVFVLATDGSRKVAAVVDPAMDTVMGWSPGGEYLLFAFPTTVASTLTSHQRTGRKNWFSEFVPFDGGESREHSIPSGRWTTWSSDGRYILFGAARKSGSFPPLVASQSGSTSSGIAMFGFLASSLAVTRLPSRAARIRVWTRKKASG
jgi:hypothetical protein